MLILVLPNSGEVVTYSKCILYNLCRVTDTIISKHPRNYSACKKAAIFIQIQENVRISYPQLLKQLAFTYNKLQTRLHRRTY